MEIITLKNISGAEVSIEPGALEVREKLAAQAAQIREVATREAAELAAVALRDISQNLKEMEAARKAVKAPVLALGKKIDALAAEFSKPLEGEKARLSLLIGSYQAEEERKAREEVERIRREELERIKAAEEEKRRAEEAERSLSFDEAFDAQEKIEKSKSVLRDASELIVNTPKSAPKIEGARIVRYVKFEVTDAAALIKTHPELFSPDSAKIGAFVKLIKPEEAPEGLRVWIETKAAAR